LLNLLGYDGESVAVLVGPSSFDCRVQREHVRLLCNLRNQVADIFNFLDFREEFLNLRDGLTGLGLDCVHLRDGFRGSTLPVWNWNAQPKHQVPNLVSQPGY
jgi:hypothetical protein